MTEPRKEVLSDSVTIWLGDCLQVAHLVDVPAVILTDPPFGIDYRSGHATPDLWSGGDRIAGDLDVRVRDQALLLLASRGSTTALVFGSWKAPRPQNTRAVLIWDKGPALGMGALDIPWKPSAEEIYVLGKGWTGTRDEGAVLYCPPVQSMACNGRLHPNEKPVALIDRLLRKSPKGLVLDPFMGSGTTGVACVNLGRSFIGIEREPKYFDIARRRITEALSRPRLPFDEPVIAKQEAFEL